MSVSFLQPTRQPPAAAAEPRAEADTRRGAPVRVMLLNDDYTPAEYVVRVLQEEFGLGGLKATWVRHRDRRVTAAVGTRATFAVGCRP